MQDRILNMTDSATWGPCPVCAAKHGVACRDTIKIGATHWRRVQRAPRRVSWWQWQKARLIAAWNRLLEREQGVAA